MKKAGSKAKAKVKGRSRRFSIPCTISPGMFSTERQVVIKLPDGEIEALVDHRSVVEEKNPRSGISINGFVIVSVIAYDKHSQHALVDLPQGSFSKGPRIRVPSAMMMVQAA